MSMLRCQIQNHEESQIIGVCLSEKCQNSRCYCIGCKIEFHKEHELMPLAQLKQWIPKCFNTFQNLITLQGDIFQLSNMLNETIRQLYCNRNQDIQSMNMSELDHFTLQLMTLQSIEQKGNIKIQNLINEIGQFGKLIKSTINSYHLLDSEKRKDQSSKNESNQIQNIKPQQKDPLMFSDKYSAIQNITIEKNGKQASGIGFALCDYVIPKNEDKILSFKYLSGFSFALGLCQLEKLIESNYQVKYTNIGHGLYLLQSNCMSYSNLDASINNKPQKVKIVPEDIISLKIKPQQQTLTWIVNKEEIFTMGIDLTKDLYPIIDLCGIVEIIDQN